jgi:hypothetical protein
VKKALTVAAAIACPLLVVTAAAVAQEGLDGQRSVDTASASANTGQLAGVGATGGLTQSDLKIEGASDSGFPLLFPVELPPRNSPQDEFLGTISNSAPKRVGTWMTTYFASSALTTDGSVAAYQVFQAPRGSQDQRCPGQRAVDRTVSGARVTICLGQNPAPRAVAYWRSVPFAADVDEASWTAEDQ